MSAKRTNLSLTNSSASSEQGGTTSSCTESSRLTVSGSPPSEPKLWDIVCKYSEAPPTAGIIWAIPKTSTYALVDIQTLSLRDRKRLCPGPQVEIFEGKNHLATLPLHLLLSTSTKTRDLYDEKPDLSTIYLWQGIGAGPIKHIAGWLNNVGSVENYPVLPKGQNAKQNLMICRAAMALGLEQSYYNHIFTTYSEKFRNLRGNDLDKETYQQIGDVETLAINGDDPLFVGVVARLAGLRRTGDMGNKAIWVNFFARHGKLAAAMQKLDGGVAGQRTARR